MNIDLKKQKVVVTGNVDIKLLIKKLTKAGRHAEIWPEKPDSKKKKHYTNQDKTKKDKEGKKKTNLKENGGKILDTQPGGSMMSNK